VVNKFCWVFVKIIWSTLMVWFDNLGQKNQPPLRTAGGELSIFAAGQDKWFAASATPVTISSRVCKLRMRT